MDVALMLVIIIFIVYNIIQYNSKKNIINLFMIFFFVGLELYGTKYPIYERLQEFQQKILNISYIVFTLFLLFIGYINRTKK